MSARTRILVPLAVFLAVLGSACNSVAPYAATVDGRRITSDELEDELRSIASNDSYVRLIGRTRNIQVDGAGRGTFDAAITALTLTRQIYYVLVENELAKRELGVTTSDLNQARAAVKADFEQDPTLFGKFPRHFQDRLVRREAELAVLTMAVNDITSPEEAARAFYDANHPVFNRACVRHILVASRERADALLARLGAGESFEVLARAESADPGSAPAGGLLGCDVAESQSDIPAPFLEATFNRPVGEVGPPVQTDFGYHVIKVDSRGLVAYEEAAAEARDHVLAEGEPKVQDVLREAMEKARIEVNPRYGRFDRTGISPAVVPQSPPPAPTGAEGATEPPAGAAPETPSP